MPPALSPEHELRTPQENDLQPPKWLRPKPDDGHPEQYGGGTTHS
jgi:hypothetical protein